MTWYTVVVPTSPPGLGLVDILPRHQHRATATTTSNAATHYGIAVVSTVRPRTADARTDRRCRRAARSSRSR